MISFRRCTWPPTKCASSKRWTTNTRWAFVQSVHLYFILYLLQTWRMEMAHAHLRTLDWVLKQKPYPGSDAQDSLDREEEMTKMKQIEVEQDADMEVEEEQMMACTSSTKDTRVPASSPRSRHVAVHRPLSPRRTRSGTLLNPKTADQEPKIEGSFEEKLSFSPRRTRQGGFFWGKRYSWFSSSIHMCRRLVDLDPDDLCLWQYHAWVWDFCAQGLETYSTNVLPVEI